MKRTTYSAALVGAIALSVCMAYSARAELTHRYSFDTDASDSVGSAGGTIQTGASVSAGEAIFDGTGGYIELPAATIAINTYTELSLEMWFSQPEIDQGFSMTAAFGGTWGNGLGQDYLHISTTRGDQVSRASLAVTPDQDAPWNDEVGVNGPELNDNQYHHYVVTISGTTISYYIDGSLIGRNANLPADAISNIETQFAYLGQGLYTADGTVQGTMDEFRIHNSALNDQDVLNSFVDGPDVVDGPGAGAVLGITVESADTDIVLGAGTTVTVSAAFENFAAGADISLWPGVTYSSDNENVATIDANGVVTTVNPGTANLTASYETFSQSVAVTVIVPERPEAVLAHRYDFGDDPGSTTLADLEGTATGTVTGVIFNGDGTASFNGGTDYIDLPDGMISALGANGTVEAWVTFSDQGGGWQRLFDFGNTSLGADPVHPLDGGEGYTGAASWFYAPRQGGITANNGGRFAFDPGPGGENPQINPPAALGAPIGEEFHVVAIHNHDQRIAQIWVNGILIGEGAIPSDRPLSALDDVNNWLGRSQWSGDANATATFNEFRVYSGAPSQLEIAVSGAAGPDQIIADPGALQTLSMQAESNSAVAGGPAVPLSLVGDYANISGVNLSYFEGVVFSSSNPDVAEVLNNPARILPISPGTVNITGSLDGQDATPLSFTVTAPSTMPTLAHRYTMDSNANDAIGGQNGTLVPTGANPAGTFEDGGLTLAGEGYVDLPNFLFGDFWFQGDPQSLPAVTIEVFGSWAGGPAWQRIFDFGDTTADPAEDPPIDGTHAGRTYAFLSPSSGGGLLDFSFNVDTTGAGDLAEVGSITAPGLGANQDYHVVVVVDPANGVTRMYRNGVFAGIGSLPASLNDVLVAGTAINDVNMWLGRSQFPADPFFNGRIEEFRIWEGAMLADQVRQNYNCGPDNPNGCSIGPAPEIALGESNGNVTLSWPAAALGFNLYSTETLGNGQFTPFGPQPLTTSGVRTTTIPPNSDTEFFLLRTDQ